MGCLVDIKNNEVNLFMCIKCLNQENGAVLLKEKLYKLHTISHQVFYWVGIIRLDVIDRSPFVISPLSTTGQKRDLWTTTDLLLFEWDHSLIAVG